MVRNQHFVEKRREQIAVAALAVDAAAVGHRPVELARLGGSEFAFPAGGRAEGVEVFGADHRAAVDHKERAAAGERGPGAPAPASEDQGVATDHDENSRFFSEMIFGYGSI